MRRTSCDEAITLVANHEMVSLEPNNWLADSSSATTILHIVCPNLVRLDEKLTIVPDLAESWEIKDEYRRFIFELRPGLTLHDGVALDAEVVAWNFARIRDSRAGSILAADYAGLAEVRVQSKTSVEFVFSGPFPSFLHHLAGRSYLTGDTALQPVGAGPYRVTDWTRGESLTLELFEDYYRPRNRPVKKVTVRWAPSGEERIELVEAGLADVIESVPSAAARSLEERGLLRLERAPGLRRTSLVFNCSEAPFDDVRVRQACALAIDRTELTSLMVGEYGRHISGAYPFDDEQWAAGLPAQPADLARARQLMREAGYGEGVKVVAAATNVAPMPKLVGKIRDIWAQIGLALDVTGYDDPPWWPLIYMQSHWQVAFQGMGARPHPDVLFGREFHSAGTFNPTHHVSPELDALIEQARCCVDVQIQRQLYRKVQAVIEEEVPTLPLYCSDALLGVAPRLSGVKAHPLGYVELTDATTG